VTLAVGSKPIAVAPMDVDGGGAKDVLVLNQGRGTAQASSDQSGGFVESNAVQLKFGISNLVLDGLMLNYAPPKPTAEHIRSCQ
jgi:hypothetical protein